MATIFSNLIIDSNNLRVQRNCTEIQTLWPEFILTLPYVFDWFAKLAEGVSLIELETSLLVFSCFLFFPFLYRLLLTKAAWASFSTSLSAMLLTINSLVIHLGADETWLRALHVNKSTQVEHSRIQTCLIILANIKFYSILICLFIEPNLNELFIEFKHYRI